MTRPTHRGHRASTAYNLTLVKQRIKCDEKAHCCSPCEKKGLQCPGYRKDVKWSDKYEWLRGSATSQEQSLHRDDSTWFVEGALQLRAAIAPSHTASVKTADAPLESTDTATSTADCWNTTHAWDTLCSSSAELYHEDHLYQNQLPYSCPEPVTDKLLRYYFSQVCGILSAFDSSQNPLRSLLKELIPSCPALLHSVLSMSSAHLYRREKDRMRYSLEHRTQAISQLASNITNVTSAEGSAPANLDTTALLLSSILLGMTSVSCTLIPFSNWSFVSLLIPYRKPDMARCILARFSAS